VQWLPYLAVIFCVIFLESALCTETCEKTTPGISFHSEAEGYSYAHCTALQPPLDSMPLPQPQVTKGVLFSV
jgi:hypothetical protein